MYDIRSVTQYLNSLTTHTSTSHIILFVPSGRRFSVDISWARRLLSPRRTREGGKEKHKRLLPSCILPCLHLLAIHIPAMSGFIFICF